MREETLRAGVELTGLELQRFLPRLTEAHVTISVLRLSMGQRPQIQAHQRWLVAADR